MKIVVNLNKYSYFLAGLIIFLTGMFIANALTPGVAPNPGHLINEIAAPAGCIAGQFLEWGGTSWKCANVKTTTVTPPATTLDLVYGLHSSKQCIALHGVVETDGTAKFCKFEGNTAITGWSMYKHWTTTRTHTCTPYSYQTCEQSYWWCCNTGAHTFNNKIPERCTYNLQNNAVGGPGTQATCNSIVTEIGYY